MLPHTNLDRYRGKFDRQPALLEPTTPAGAHLGGIPGGIPDRSFRHPSRGTEKRTALFLVPTLVTYVTVLCMPTATTPLSRCR